MDSVVVRKWGQGVWAFGNPKPVISAGTYLFVQRLLHLIEYQQGRGYTAPLNC